MTSGAPSREWFALILSVGLDGTKESWLAGGWVGARVGSEVLLEEKLGGANRALRDLRNGGAVQVDPASREGGFSQCSGQVRKSGLLTQGGQRAGWAGGSRVTLASFLTASGTSLFA